MGAVSTKEKEIIRVLQEGIPLVERPFQVLAEKLGLSEEELIGQIVSLREQGIIRRFGATLRQKEVGLTANAMVVWDVPEDQVDQAGKILAGFPQVTHCYRRPRRPDWSYNLFTMIHGSNRDYCQALAEKMARTAGLKNFSLLYSTRELKKSSMRYFT
ncbi:MAG: Lrp/AsnC family transcriptional regulator [Peptococcaceae bacterium]|nr:Lrp/AsnC family transcriptional regulator [Peptococcaceae bacterium]